MSIRLASFTKIRDARNIDNDRRKVNIIGVVLHHGFPRETRGTDWYYHVTIVDDTYQGTGLPTSIFFESEDKSPRVKSPGDIIQLNNVMMKIVEGEKCAVFNKKFSSFALYDGRDGITVPYQKSQLFRERDQDKTPITALRRWFWDFPINEGPDDFLFAKDLIEEEHFNLFCKVLHVCNGPEGQWTAFVWDGTDAPPATIHKSLSEEKHQPLALHLEPYSLARDIVCGFPAVGTVLRVMYEDLEPDFLPLLGVGNWVKLENLICELHEGLWRVVLTRYSKVHYTSNRDQIKPEPQRLYDKRLSQNPRNLRRMPEWCLPWPSRITEVDFEDDRDFHTLMDVVRSPELMVGFKCVVRVVSMMPSRTVDFLYPDGVPRIRLTLEDPTTRIHAYLYPEDGRKLFGTPTSEEVLSRKRGALLGASAEDAPRNPLWVQVCLRAECLIEGDLESKVHKVYGTKLKD